jgi:hypothetical protein
VSTKKLGEKEGKLTERGPNPCVISITFFKAGLFNDVESDTN